MGASRPQGACVFGIQRIIGGTVLSINPVITMYSMSIVHPQDNAVGRNPYRIFGVFKTLKSFKVNRAARHAPTAGYLQLGYLITPVRAQCNTCVL